MKKLIKDMIPITMSFFRGESDSKIAWWGSFISQEFQNKSS